MIRVYLSKKIFDNIRNIYGCNLPINLLTVVWFEVTHYDIHISISQSVIQTHKTKMTVNSSYGLNKIWFIAPPATDPLELPRPKICYCCFKNNIFCVRNKKKNEVKLSSKWPRYRRLAKEKTVLSWAIAIYLTVVYMVIQKVNIKIFISNCTCGMKTALKCQICRSLARKFAYWLCILNKINKQFTLKYNDKNIFTKMYFLPPDLILISMSRWRGNAGGVTNNILSPA